MSKASIVNRISRLQRDLADITRRISQESKREADCSNIIARIRKSITKNTKPNQLNSKLSEINRRQDELSKIQSRRADLERKEADTTSKLYKYRDDLEREEERERKRQIDEEKKRGKEQLQFHRTMKRELEAQRRLTRQFEPDSRSAAQTIPDYDLFISHASEDKNDFVRPLANALKSLDMKVWYDEITLELGDSLRENIDKGLLRSKYGAVVLSPFFFAKNWTQYELNGMVVREMNGEKVILPIWHRVTKDEVLAYSPNLADRVALNSSTESIYEIATRPAERVLK